MKISLVALTVFAVVAASAAGALAGGRALAATSHNATTKTVKVVMHDPGCHWFTTNGKFTTKKTVQAGHVRIVDLDEAALKVASPQGKLHIAVGKSIVVGHGVYKITMVGQAPDDNHLRLIVN
jgi:hypothetical protein